MDLSPRTGSSTTEAVAGHRRRSLAVRGLLLALVVALGLVAYRGLTDAALYFYNADEAVEQRSDLGDRRFRLQGSVQGDVRDTADGVAFSVRFNDVPVKVRHHGDPPELFAPGIPVLLEGRWSPAGEVFDSDRILVKHSEQYQADNGDRLADADDGAADDGTAP